MPFGMLAVKILCACVFRSLFSNYIFFRDEHRTLRNAFGKTANFKKPTTTTRTAAAATINIDCHLAQFILSMLIAATKHTQAATKTNKKSH